MTAIHSLRGDLADAIVRDLAAFGCAQVYGPLSTMVRVWNVADRVGAVVTTNSYGHWLITKETTT